MIMVITEIRSVRREIKLTRKENKILEELIRKDTAENFSEFARKRLLGNYPSNQEIERIFLELLKIELLHEIRNLSREIGRVRELAEGKDKVTEEHVSIILRCVQELNNEIDKVIPLSKSFREKYIYK